MANYYVFNENKSRQDNRGDAENPRDKSVFRGWRSSGSLFRKNQNPSLDMVYGSVSIELQVCISFRCGQKHTRRRIVWPTFYANMVPSHDVTNFNAQYFNSLHKIINTKKS